MSESDLYEDGPTPESPLGDVPEVPDAAAADASEAAPARKRRRKSMWDDPVVRWMTAAALGLVALYLVGVVSAIVTGNLGSTVPRTKLERDIMYYEGRAAQTPEDTSMWRDYALALMQAKQYAKAEGIIKRAKRAVEESATMDISFAEAQLQFDRGQYAKSIKTCNVIQEALADYYTKQRRTPGTPEYLGGPVSETYYSSLILEAEAENKKGDPKKAVKVLDLYLHDRPTEADVLVRRGYLKIAAGDKRGAEEDFRTALKYLPDDPGALAGLKKIGVNK